MERETSTSCAAREACSTAAGELNATLFAKPALEVKVPSAAFEKRGVRGVDGCVCYENMVNGLVSRNAQGILTEDTARCNRSGNNNA
jgi:hypothetical protein